MYDNKIEYNGDVFDRELVTRDIRLGYAIKPKMAKRGCAFQK
jgi:hypothetical protein